MTISFLFIQGLLGEDRGDQIVISKFAPFPGRAILQVCGAINLSDQVSSIEFRKTYLFNHCYWVHSAATNLIEIEKLASKRWPKKISRKSKILFQNQSETVAGSENVGIASESARIATPSRKSISYAFAYSCAV